MKIIKFHGGLGNQIFEYMHYMYLKTKFPQESFYSFFPSRALKAHYGLEINKWFDVELPPTSVITNYIGNFLFWTNKILCRMNIAPLMTSDDLHIDGNKLFFEGYYQDKQFIEGIDALPKFKCELCLDEKNLEMLAQMTYTNSVSVHIRRGDYLNSKTLYMYGNICTPEYYEKAITIIKSKVQNPFFFFFSDDIQYVKETYNLDNMKIVDINKGEKSPLDMYLMSHCKNMILANSTFSCWSAYLNKNVEYVVCPAKMMNVYDVPVLLDNWIKI